MSKQCVVNQTQTAVTEVAKFTCSAETRCYDCAWYGEYSNSWLRQITLQHIYVQKIKIVQTKQEAQLSQRDCAMLRVIEYFHKSLKVIRHEFSATSNTMKLVHWPLMGGLLHLVQRGGACAGCGPAQSPSRCTKCNSLPINGQCTNHRILYNGPLLYGFNVDIKGLSNSSSSCMYYHGPVLFSSESGCASVLQNGLIYFK